MHLAGATSMTRSYVRARKQEAYIRISRVGLLILKWFTPNDETAVNTSRRTILLDALTLCR